MMIYENKQSLFSLEEVNISSFDDDVIKKLHLLQEERIAYEGKYISFDIIINEILKKEL